ncbi:lymphoid-restricted membrane protein isoform X2 [Astatotilapia calliptera]|uniref:lymphoid-restricted membrane protein isoform X2 n=1 Tax=Astatotilapia calliptera TaxID=8154 RepID=UPI000E4026F6|nr:lymphoid-restricted membrane protein-like isoform X2 [Astatotilapia calliptera]
MSAEPEAEISSYNLPNMPDSDDSGEETSQEEPPIASWSELPIIERVGLNSVEMSEKDLETAFSQIALSLRCDQYTLKQRLQAEEHARNLAEENIQLELSRGRETLEILKSLCLDNKRSEILQKLELSLDILGGTVERISNTAEVLGAVHQEARVSRAVELMVAHVERLRKRYDRNLAELEEARRMMMQQQQQQSSCRNITDPRASTGFCISDQEESDNIKKDTQQHIRRRVCVSVISSQTQDRKKQDSRKRLSSSKKAVPFCPSPMSSESSCSFMNKDDRYSVEDRPHNPDETPSEALPGPAPILTPESPPSKPVNNSKTLNKNFSLDTLRHRHKGKAVLSNKGREKKMANICRRISTVGMWRQHPLTHWLQRCRLVLLCTFVIFCVVTLSYFLW